MPSTTDLAASAARALAACGATVPAGSSPVTSPITGGVIATVGRPDAAAVLAAVDDASAAFVTWRTTPAPVRGALVKHFGRLLEEHKADLAELVTLEVGKIRSEALGEIQEMIDVCDYAVGLSRSMAGRTLPSERPGHRLFETWHPRGVVAVISAFNFPAAVWAWNTAVALVCGDTVVWKPSETTPLTSLACSAILDRAIAETGSPDGVHRLVLAERDDAAALLDDPRVALVSATGSERMGREIAPRVAARFGETLLELGGNNAAVVAPSADLDLAVRGITFAAAGTAGQRCTTMRRLVVHESVVEDLLGRLVPVYEKLRIGDPTDADVLVGPLVNEGAYEKMQAAIAEAVADGGTLLVGGDRQPSDDGAYYVRPAIVRMPAQTDVVRRETFAPLLYVMTYTTLDEAIAVHNDVPQGLSSSIFTLDQREAELFLSAAGSDCGIANVNIGTSGAEIGGAFGGEKTTGGGRESGSDAWRAYMRRATNTVNYSTELPLAQGVSFG
ncbi:aldehyde dehydrogenase family protein [Kineosporia sp. A_224]|uniref:L-piperidine-6-carboxylate dehydrogenase n=1 Tax=Kineosporia sp. A_224 TaxID=1962180 RepID=UPI000B4BDA50|nr:aldehyde dehydrogenase family protein [Kineosporia sp. A_224]MBI4939980.1 aldehyde dehydrogenase family protein [Actinomycetota bacterium]